MDLLGNPVRPAAATGDLMALSLYGKDPLRPGIDPTGRIRPDSGQFAAAKLFRDRRWLEHGWLSFRPAHTRH